MIETLLVLILLALVFPFLVRALIEWTIVLVIGVTLLGIIGFVVT